MLRSAVLGAHVSTWRPYTSVYPGLLAVMGITLAPAGIVPWQAALASGTAVVMWISGHYLADACDQALDARSKPWRPIPSGRLTVRAALLFGAAGFVASVSAAALLGGLCLAACLLCLAAMAGYMCGLKARGIAGHLVRGVVSGGIVCFGAAAAGRGVGLDAALLAVGLTAHDTASNIVGALRDVDGDRAAGCRTLPVQVGTHRASWVAALFYSAAAAAVLVGSGIVDKVAPASAALFGGAGLLAAWAFVLALSGGTALSQAVALRAHALLVVERTVLAGACIAVHHAGLGLWLALPSLLATWLLQVTMRPAYELPDSHRSALADAVPAIAEEERT